MLPRAQSKLLFEPILKDGIKFEDITAENKIKEDTQTIINKYYKLLRDKDMKDISKMLRRNKLSNNLNTRKLNEDFPIDQYKFVKCNGKLHLFMILITIQIVL